MRLGRGRHFTLPPTVLQPADAADAWRILVHGSADTATHANPPRPGAKPGRPQRKRAACSTNEMTSSAFQGFGMKRALRGRR